MLSVELKGIKAQLCLKKHVCIFGFQLQLDEAPLDTWVARRTVTAGMDAQANDRALSRVPLGNYSACAPGRAVPSPIAQISS